MGVFNKIRRSAILSKSLKGYIKYGVGEILIVVIGMFFTLQINNWNDRKKEYEVMKPYFSKMHEEINSTRRGLCTIKESLEISKSSTQTIINEDKTLTLVFERDQLTKKDEIDNSSADKKEKEESLKEIECVLHFTLRMHNNFNTLYFDTAFLQKSNTNVSLELQQLFADYTQPIK
jgi:hypothetical protein